MYNTKYVNYNIKIHVRYKIKIGRVRGNDFTDREKYHGAFQVSDNADP
jgi:hypothetical protein